jgi:cell division septation protein DedD
VFFRLRAGPLADRAAAESLCATLSAQNVGCIVVRP